MKKLFQIILMILHCIALIFIAVVNFSRICFYATWPPKDDLILWTFVIFVFFYPLYCFVYRAQTEIYFFRFSSCS